MTTKVLKYYLNANQWILSKQQWLYLLSCVNKNECAYIYQFKHKNDCKIRLLSQMLIRYSIKELTNLHWNEVEIDKYEHGKPYFIKKRADKTYLDFNISHSNEFIAICAIHTPIDYHIGVDIMKVENTDLNRHLNQSQRIMKKAFTAHEREFVQSKPTIEKQLETFYRIWTLKESYLKAIGKGIRSELNLFEFIIKTEINNQQKIIDNTELYINSINNFKCKFYEELINNHVTSICLHKNEQSLSDDDHSDLKKKLFKELSIDEIIRNTLPIVEQGSDHYWDLYLNKN